MYCPTILISLFFPILANLSEAHAGNQFALLNDDDINQERGLQFVDEDKPRMFDFQKGSFAILTEEERMILENNSTFLGVSLGDYYFSDPDIDELYGEDVAIYGFDMVIKTKNPHFAWQIAYEQIEDLMGDVNIIGVSGGVLYRTSYIATPFMLLNKVQFYGGTRIGFYSIAETKTITWPYSYLAMKGEGLGVDFYGGVAFPLFPREAPEMMSFGFQYNVKKLKVDMVGGGKTFKNRDYGWQGLSLIFNMAF